MSCIEQKYTKKMRRSLEILQLAKQYIKKDNTQRDWSLLYELK